MVRKVATGTSTTLERALGVLNDPEIQKLIVDLIHDHADTIADILKQGGAWVADQIDGVGDRFGQRGLERRATNLRATVVWLSDNSSALATSLRPVTESLDEVDKLLTVAAALPFAKRKRAHWKIDDVLDHLEKGLFDAALQHAQPDREA